jgi:hypothetical protein
LGTNQKNSQVAKTAQATQLIAGVAKHLASMSSIMLESTAYTPAQITSDLQQLVSLYAAVAAAKAAYQAKLAAVKAQAPNLLSLMAALVAYVRLTYANSPDVLADFGLPPKKEKTPLTTEQQTVANAKNAATREARGTTSKKAKKAVKGAVVGVTVTPVVAGPPVASSSTPSAAAAAPAVAATGTTASKGA